MSPGLLSPPCTATLKPVPVAGTNSLGIVNCMACSRLRRRKFFVVENFSMTETGALSTRLRNCEVEVCQVIETPSSSRRHSFQGGFDVTPSAESCPESRLRFGAGRADDRRPRAGAARTGSAVEETGALRAAAGRIRRQVRHLPFAAQVCRQLPRQDARGVGTAPRRDPENVAPTPGPLARAGREAHGQEAGNGPAR